MASNISRSLKDEALSVIGRE